MLWSKAAGAGGVGGGGAFITEFSYDSVSYDIANNYDFALGMQYGDGGNALFIARSEGTADDIGKLNLTSTDSVAAVTTGGKGSVNSQDGAPYQSAFKSDGSKMYVLGGVSDAIYQYSLSTNWLSSSLTYDSVSFSTATEAATPRDMQFYGDGTGFAVLDRGDDTIEQYSLSTAWDLSTASADGSRLSFTSEASVSSAFCYNSDGTILLVASEGGTIYQYDLSTAWEPSSGTYSGDSLDVSAQATNVLSIALNSDDTVLFVLEDLSRGTIFQYSSS